MSPTGTVTVPELHAMFPDVPAYSIRYACRTGQIEGARSTGSVWLMPAAAAAEWATQYTRYGSLRQPRGGRQRDLDP